GRRRIYALRRDPLRQLATWLGTTTEDHPSEAVLDEYRAAIDAEPTLPPGRTVRLRRTLHAPSSAVWTRWTSAQRIRVWWHPEHFTVAECEARPVPGGRLRIVMEEGDGTRHVGDGRYL